MDDIKKIFNINVEVVENAEKLWEEEERKEKFRLFCKTVPERYWNESLETYRAETTEQKKALNLAHRFVNGCKAKRFITLVFLGSVGTGKTHLACSALREVGGKYKTISEICTELEKSRSFSSSETEEELLKYYGSRPLLVIDEIGRGNNPQKEQYAIYQVMNARYNKRKPTILISNKSKKEFFEYIGNATADRLTESAQVMEFNGSSYRVKLRAGK